MEIISEEISKELAKIRASDEDAALVNAASVRACASTEMATKMLVKIDGSTVGSIGGGELEANVIEAALQVLKQGKPHRLRIGVSPEEEQKRGMESGGKLKYFIEPVSLLPTLFIFGAGELSFHIAKYAKLLGYIAIVIDNDVEFANTQRFPEVDLIIVDDPEKALSKLKIGESSYIIIATRNHTYDELVLQLSIPTRAVYIGMAACSEEKKKRYFSRLLAKGIPESQLDRVHAPIGLDINAQTMEEIALSIIAEIVKIARSKF